MAVANREYIEKLIYDTFDAIDPSGMNSNKYRIFFAEMDDKAFEKWIKEFLKDDNEQFVLDVVDFENDLKMENCEKAAKVLGIPLMEYVYMPHLTMDRKRVVFYIRACILR